MIDARAFERFRDEYEARYGPLRDYQWAEMLGISSDSMTRLKQRGAPLHSGLYALAFTALMHNMGPWKAEDGGDEKER